MIWIATLEAAWFMIVWSTLIALSTDPAIGALLGRRNSDLLDLMAIWAWAWVTWASHRHLLGVVAGGSWTTLLFALHTGHIHDVIEYLLLVAWGSTIGGYVCHIDLLSVCCVLWWVYGQATRSHRLMTLTWLWDTALLMHDSDALRATIVAWALLFLCVSPLNLWNSIFWNFNRLLL